MKTGRPETYAVGDGELLPVLRHDSEPPCRGGFQCPKGSPEDEHLHVLNPRNEQLLQLFHEHKAMGGGVADSGDAWTRRGFEICESLLSRQKAKQLASELASALAVLLR